MAVYKVPVCESALCEEGVCKEGVCVCEGSCMRKALCKRDYVGGRRLPEGSAGWEVGCC